MSIGGNQGDTSTPAARTVSILCGKGRTQKQMFSQSKARAVSDLQLTTLAKRCLTIGNISETIRTF